MYYFLNNMINIKNFDSNLLKIDKKSQKNIDIYYIGYITMKYFDYENIHCVNPFYFIINKAHGYIEGINGNKTLVSTEKKKEVVIKYKELQDKIKY